MTDRYYAIDVAAAASGVPASTIRRWIADPDRFLPSIMHNGRRYVTLQSVIDCRDTPRRRRSLNSLRK